MPIAWAGMWGLACLVLVVLAVVLIPALRFVTDLSLDRRRGALLFALFVFIVLHNGTESTLFDRDAVLSLTLMVVLALLADARRMARMRA